jgi:hypothetical protein
MKMLDVEFARPPDHRRVQWILMGLLAVLTVGLLASGMRDRSQSRALISQLDARVAQARADAATLEARRAAAAASVPAYAADAWRAWRVHQFPLNSVLTALETVAVVGIRVVSVDINAVEQSVRVQVEFPDYDTLMTYLRDLNAGEPVERWMLVSAQTNAGSIAARPTATLASNWAP